MKLSAERREELRKYARDLYERTLKVPCPRCGVAAGEPCKGTFGPVKYRHVDRANEARKRGFVRGNS
jgi:hypothetical protein